VREHVPELPARLTSVSARVIGVDTVAYSVGKSAGMLAWDMSLKGI